MRTGCDALIPLRNGPSVPVSVYYWLTAAAERGLLFRIEPDGWLHVGPQARVEAGDLEFIQQHRNAVLACVEYIEKVPPC